MLLSNLLRQAPTNPDPTITHVVDDSRLVQKGSVFVVDADIMPNPKSLVKMAQEKGASYIIGNIALEGVTYHPRPGRVLARWAKHTHPNQPSQVVGVTGTNGKTSVAWFYNQLLNGTGKKAASVGTLGVHQGSTKLLETGYTSPTALKTHEILEDLSTQNISHTCMEVSSHALQLYRLDGVKFSAAALTNITQDHLDFHKTMENYTAAKYRLFAELLPEDATAVLNITRPECWPLAALCKERGLSVLTYGTGQAELVVRPVKAMSKGMQLEIKFATHKEEVTLPLIGTFQAENLAAALGLALASGASWPKLMAALPHLSGVPGRMELMPSTSTQPAVVVDYAHTPDALERALTALRPLCQGNLIVVFGCGGDRDKEKRPKMGEIAQKLADHILITDDNPRTENAQQIRAEILAACPKGEEIADRKKAIKHAMTSASANDMILLAGKGHESGQIIGTETLPFNDREIAHQTLENL